MILHKALLKLLPGSCLFWDPYCLLSRQAQLPLFCVKLHSFFCHKDPASAVFYLEDMGAVNSKRGSTENAYQGTEIHNRSLWLPFHYILLWYIHLRCSEIMMLCNHSRSMPMEWQTIAIWDDIFWEKKKTKQNNLQAFQPEECSYYLLLYWQYWENLIFFFFF